MTEKITLNNDASAPFLGGRQGHSHERPCVCEVTHVLVTWDALPSRAEPCTEGTPSRALTGQQNQDLGTHGAGRTPGPKSRLGSGRAPPALKAPGVTAVGVRGRGPCPDAATAQTQGPSDGEGLGPWGTRPAWPQEGPLVPTKATFRPRHQGQHRSSQRAISRNPAPATPSRGAQGAPHLLFLLHLPSPQHPKRPPRPEPQQASVIRKPPGVPGPALRRLPP